ncbi:MAG: lysophospholipid acyltransferase family protein [Candidatus Omnitrophica bacterium]|nr:lysophospholipid acyltransferase family protein [Candidatus Omnitrophota bacterium]
MALYILYRIAHFLVNVLPLKASYGLASFLAYIYYLASRRDRMSIIRNMEIISGGITDPEKLKRMARELYLNFAKYLVDFFRSSKIDAEYVKRFAKFEGIHNLDNALKRGKGVILLSAHIGNWELGGFVISMSGYPVSAVALTHPNKKIDDFFKRQRLAGSLTPIEIGMGLKSCYKVLRSNNVLGLLGDRDFTKNGLMLDFFGKKTLFPKGPSVFSYRLGSAVVPTFITREPDDSFRVVFETPMLTDQNKSEEDAVLELGKKCASIIESYVRLYPTQWYIFKDMWSKDE